MNKILVTAATAILIALPAVAGDCGTKATRAQYTEGHLTKDTYQKVTTDIAETAAAAGSFSNTFILLGEKTSRSLLE